MRSLFVLKSELKDRINLKLFQLPHAVRTFFYVVIIILVA